MVDECHRATGAYASVALVQKLRKACCRFRVLGLSATPGSDYNAVQASAESDVDHFLPCGCVGGVQCGASKCISFDFYSQSDHFAADVDVKQQHSSQCGAGRQAGTGRQVALPILTPLYAWSLL